MSSISAIVSSLLAIAAIWARHVTRAACGGPPEPLAFPITDFQVDPAVSDSFMKGLQAMIGTPQQKVATVAVGFLKTLTTARRQTTYADKPFFQ